MQLEQWQVLQQQFKKGCVFCAPDESLVITRTEKFGVMFDVAPLVSGHIIIFAMLHYGCAGELPREDMDEVVEVKKMTRRLLTEVYGNVTFYEHGRAGHCLSDGPEHRLCHHFHLHAVPTAVDLTNALTARFPRVAVNDYRELPDLYEQYGDYLFVESPAEEMSYLPVTTSIERHLIRTMIAERVGRPELADWRGSGFVGLLNDGMARVQVPGLLGGSTPRNG